MFSPSNARLGLTIGIVAVSVSSVQGALFLGIGDLPGGPDVSMAMNVSADGSVVVGGASRGTYTNCCGRIFTSFEVVRWTFEHGLQSLGTLPDEYTGRAWDVSADGNVIVGRSNEPGLQDPPSQAFRWTAGAGMQPIATTIGGPCRGTTADAVSGDGSTVVGRSFSGEVGGYGCVTEAYAVQAEDPMLPLGSLRGFNESSAEAVSFDGSIIMGQSNRRPGSQRRGWIWREETGIVDIGAIEGHREVVVRSMSSNGQYIIGRSRRNSSDDWTGYVWSQDEGMNPQPISWPTSVSDDGTVVGQSFGEDMVWRTSIWSEASGARSLEDVLTRDLSAGEQMVGWDINDVGEGRWIWHLSDDGSVIVGTGINPDGNTEGWVAILRESGVEGDFNEDSRLDGLDISLLSVQIREGTKNPVFDLNGDSVVDGADRNVWVSNLANTYFGDANLDGEFNSSDLVAVFRAGQYEDAIDGNSGWADGDWNGDGDFDSSDLVVAFDQGSYEQGPRQAGAAVPEPVTWPLALASLVAILCRRHVALRLVRQVVQTASKPPRSALPMNHRASVKTVDDPSPNQLGIFGTALSLGEARFVIGVRNR